MGQQEELAVVLKPPAAVVFSWEPLAVTTTTKPTAAETRRDATVTKPPGSPTTTKKAAGAPPAARRLSVPPPPGRAAMRSLSARAGGRAVRPEDDPFLAAYLACTKSSRGSGKDAGCAGGTASEAKQARSRFTWARLGLSCKGSAGVVEKSMVKVARRPELDPRDA